MAAQKLLPFFIVSALVFLVDWYVFHAIRALIHQADFRKWFSWCFWMFSFVTFCFFLYFRLVGQNGLPRLVLVFAFSSFFIVFLSKLIFSIFLLGGDVTRGLAIAGFWIKNLVTGDGQNYSPARSAALVKIGLGIAGIPLFTLVYGMFKGAYRYQLKRMDLVLKDLPKAFEGLKIVQISDMHTGSFYNKKAVNHGIDLLLNEKPDLIFFTGDLVNNEASEVVDYLDIFKRIAAPLGVFSVLGNHDYGDYMIWPSQQAKEANLEQLKQYQKELGWRLLLDEHVVISRDGDQMALVGIQNWGAKGNFPKYGNLKRAMEGAETYAVKLLLSHDPSHWEAQVLPQFPEIDAMFAGHTHGMQFGIEIPGFKWSPVQYMYKQWAGLYQATGGQQLYVNRGFGFIGYPGRVGIWPEISVFTLKRGQA